MQHASFDTRVGTHFYHQYQSCKLVAPHSGQRRTVAEEKDSVFRQMAAILHRASKAHGARYSAALHLDGGGTPTQNKHIILPG